MECILTVDMLRRRDNIMFNRCVLCKNVESCNHILLWCPAVYCIWSTVHGLMGLTCVVAGSVRVEVVGLGGGV